MNTGVFISGHRVTMSAMSVAGLIEYAYDLKSFQVAGGPDWIRLDRYDIAAKTDGPSAPTPDQVRRMLQTLLADRFQLKGHRETKDLPAYALIVGKSGSKLRESAAGAKESLTVTAKSGLVQMTVIKGSMEQLARQLSSNVDRPVLDRTGLSGHYDYKLVDWIPETRTGATASSGPSIVTAIQEQLGLRLEPVKGPVNTFLVDRIERPSDN